MGDLAGRGDFVAGPHPGLLFGSLEVLLVEEFVEGLVVFAGVFCLEGAEAHIGVDFRLLCLRGCCG